MADSWELPFGETLTWTWPSLVREWIGDRPERLHGPRDFARRWLYDRASQAMLAHDAYARRLGEHLPNLCAVHVALLLRQRIG